MKLELGQKFEFELDEGTAIDFIDDEWVLVVKDEFWTEYECKALKRNKVTISFVERGIVDLFLIQVEDALETSDCPFNVHADDYSSCFKEFNKGEGYLFNVVYLNKENEIIAKRTVRLNTEMSNCISSHLKNQNENQVEEIDFEASLAKIQSKCEPFECEEFALISNQF